jgi:hypothetical protein
MLLYLECRFSNSITTASCDCNQLLAGEKKTADTVPVNTHANHKHLPEEFEKEEMKVSASLRIHLNNNSFYLTLSPRDFITEIFHPPLG